MNAKDIESILSQLRNADVTGNRPYKVYAALLTQTGENAPVVTELENTLNASPTSAYSMAGAYTLQFASGILTSKTAVLLTVGSYAGSVGGVIGAVRTSNNIVITSMDFTGTLADDILKSGTIEIRVYP